MSTASFMLYEILGRSNEVDIAVVGLCVDIAVVGLCVCKSRQKSQPRQDRRGIHETPNHDLTAPADANSRYGLPIPCLGTPQWKTMTTAVIIILEVGLLLAKNVPCRAGYTLCAVEVTRDRHQKRAPQQVHIL